MQRHAHASRRRLDNGDAAVSSCCGGAMLTIMMPIVRCNAMVWTDETEEAALMVLVTRSVTIETGTHHPPAWTYWT